MSDEKREWNIACSYGAHSWTPVEHHEGDTVFLKKCSECGSTYQCTEIEWKALGRPATLEEAVESFMAAAERMGAELREKAGGGSERPRTFVEPEALDELFRDRLRESLRPYCPEEK